MLVWVVVLLLAVVVVGLLVDRVRSRRQVGDDDLPHDLAGLRREVAALRSETRGSLRHLSVVRYDAFGDQGGHLSWSLAILDEGGTGVVVTSIHGRSEARTYAKSITGWTTDQKLSPEEQDAVEHARPR